ncbi:MAG: hypothetical protein AB4057_06170 [Crocosphaera sp.]
MTDLIIADSTCLIGLERIGRIDLLPQMYYQVTIPPEVQKEFGLYFSRNGFYLSQSLKKEALILVGET